MVKMLYPVEAVQAIANAIRAKNGSSDKYTIGQMANAINNIPSGDDSFERLIDRSIVNVNIPNGITSIGTYSFYYCRGIKKIIVPSSVTSIGEYAFGYCNALEEINLPEGLLTVGKNAFNNCRVLTDIIIPSTVINLTSYTFQNCAGLINLTVKAVNPPTITSNAFTNIPATQLNIFVPSGSVDAYKSASGWSTRADYIQAIVE